MRTRRVGDFEEIRKLIKEPQTIIEEGKKKLIQPNSLTSLKRFADNFPRLLKDQVIKKMGITATIYNNLCKGYKETISFGKILFSPIELTTEQMDKLIEISEFMIQELQDIVKAIRAKKRTMKVSKPKSKNR